MLSSHDCVYDFSINFLPPCIKQTQMHGQDTKKAHYIWWWAEHEQCFSKAYLSCMLNEIDIEVICPSIVEQGTVVEFHRVWKISTAWPFKASSSLRAVKVLKTELSKLWINIKLTQSHCFKTNIKMYIAQIKLHGTIHWSSSKTIIWPGQTQHD